MKDRVSHVVCRAALATGLASFAFTSARAGVSANAYVQDGLVAQYDGIENVGAGQFRADAAAWKDLKGQGGDMPLGGLTSPVWDGKGLSFSACGMYNSTVTTEFLCTPNVLKLGDEFTIQMFCNTGDKYDCRRWDVVPYANSYETWTSSGEGFLERINNANRFSLKPWVSNADIIFTTVVGDKKHRFMIEPIGGTAQSVEGNLPSCVVNNRLAFMKTNGANVPRKDCYSIRIYNRALTADEVARNAGVDKIRFLGPEAAETEGWRYNDATGKLEARVRAEVDGHGTVRIDDGDAGADASSDWHDVTAGETVTVVAEPAEGYSFESWLGDASLTAEQKISTTLTLSVDRARALTAHFVHSSRWIYKSSTISNTVNGVVMNVSATGTELRCNSCKNRNGATELDLTLPIESANGETTYALTGLGDLAFYSGEASNFTTVLFPDTLKTFGAQVFDCNANIQTVRLPRQLKTVNGYTFRNCTALATILPEDWGTTCEVTSYGGWAFSGCSKLAHTFNVEKVTSFGNSAFAGVSKSFFTTDGTLYLTNATSVGDDAFKGAKDIYRVILSEGTIKTFGFSNCSSVTNITPFLPDSVTSVGSFSGCTSLRGCMKVANPAVTKVGSLGGLPQSASKISGLDLRGSSVSEWSANQFWYATSLTNVWFAKNFVFPEVSSLFNGTQYRHFYFSGDASVPDREHFYNATKMTFLLPKWNKTWTDLLADTSVCTVSEMTSGNVSSYRADYPGEPVPTQRVKFAKFSQTAYLRFWTPDKPDASTEGDVGYAEAMESEGVSPQASAPLLFDRTTYALGAADLCWTAAAGTEVTCELPQEATIARGMKFVGYTLHQMSAGTGPNVRAPTAWRLYGKLAGQAGGDWLLIDEQTMTEDSPAKWKYYGQNVETVPPRAEASLHFTVQEERQKAYVAFKFVPTASYQTEHEVGDAAPIGLEEIELFGKILPMNAVVDTCAYEKSGWKSLAFGARLLQTGYNAVTSATAAWAKGRIEVSATADFTGEILSSAQMDMAAGQDVSLTVPELAVASDYYARLIVDNSFGVATTNVLEGSYRTLAHPWEAKMPVPTYGGDGKLIVRLPLPQLFTEATVTFDRSSKPDEWQQTERRTVTAEGDVTFAPVVAAGDFEFVRVTVAGMVDGESHAETFWTASREAWLTNGGTISTISNLWSGVVCNVTATDATSLKFSSVKDMAGGTTLNLNCPFAKPDGTRLVMTDLGGGNSTALATWEKAIETMYLPDTVTKIGGQWFDGNSSFMLRKLHLPERLETLGGYAFRSCGRLKEIDNMFPKALTNIGIYAFYGCALTNDVHVRAGGVKFGDGNVFGSCSSIRRVYFHSLPPASVPSGVFGPMSKLAFFVPQLRVDVKEAWDEYLAQSCTVTPATSAEKTAFAQDYPGEGRIREMVKLPSGASTSRYLSKERVNGLLLFVR